MCSIGRRHDHAGVEDEVVLCRRACDGCVYGKMLTVETPMESLISIEKRKERGSSASVSSQESSPAGKRPKHGSSSSVSDDEVMAALSLSEGLAEKVDQILIKLSKLDLLEKIIDINAALKSVQDSVEAIDKDLTAVKEKQKSLDSDIVELKKSATFVGDQVGELKNRKKELSDVRKELLYLEAYSRRENLKFEGIEEQLQQANGEEKEDTKAKLVDFMQNILGIDDAHEIEFQRVHRMGRRPKEGVAGRPIIARFLRYPDRERVFKCG